MWTKKWARGKWQETEKMCMEHAETQTSEREYNSSEMTSQWTFPNEIPFNIYSKLRTFSTLGNKLMFATMPKKLKRIFHQESGKSVTGRYEMRVENVGTIWASSHNGKIFYRISFLAINFRSDKNKWVGTYKCLLRITVAILMEFSSTIH